MRSWVPYILLLVTQETWASWLCREASSEANGDYFYSCGVAKSKSLSEARRKSLNNAKEEFYSFCRESKNCKGFEYIIRPLRTDCKEVNKTFTCYRGLEYRILPTKKRSIDINLEEINKEIKEKEEQLRRLREKHNKVIHLNELNNNIDAFNKMDALEIQIDDLEEKKSAIIKFKQSNFGFVFSYTNIPLSYDDESVFGIGLEYEKLLINNFLGARFRAYPKTSACLNAIIAKAKWHKAS